MVLAIPQELDLGVNESEDGLLGLPERGRGGPLHSMDVQTIHPTSP